MASVSLENTFDHIFFRYILGGAIPSYDINNPSIDSIYKKIYALRPLSDSFN